MDTKTMSCSYSCTCTIILSLFTIYSCLVGATTNTSVSVVLDVDGNELQSHTKYYIFTPPGGGRVGGGLSLSIRNYRDPCPLYATQENNGSSVGGSLKIFPTDGKREIRLQSDVNLAFMEPNICMNGPAWRISDSGKGKGGRRYVRTGGILGRPGAGTVRNWFKIERGGEEGGYKIVYCPKVCRECRVECGHVGVFVEKDRRWLALGGQPLLVAFKRVHDADASISNSNGGGIN